MAHFSFNQDLLNRDEVEGEEQVIGKSFNIEHEVNGEVKWIPRNKLHKILAAHENLFRKQYYQAEGIRRDYSEVENTILRRQERMDIRNDSNYRIFEFIVTYNSGYRLCFEENLRRRPWMSKWTGYPCFAIGILSSVDDNRVNLIEIVTIPYSFCEDSEVNIFIRAKDLLPTISNNYKNSKKIILDIHSSLELPSSPKMVDNIKSLLRRYKNLFINVSYYGSYGAWELGNEIPRFQQFPIELVREPTEKFDDLIINIFPSGGLEHHKPAVKTAMENILSADYQAELNRKFDEAVYNIFPSHGDNNDNNDEDDDD